MGTVVLRTFILYICISFCMRIMGKRQLGELQPSELAVTLLVSNIATLSIEDTNIPLLGSLLPILTLVSCEVLVSMLILKSRKARKIISGNPCIIIQNGVIDQKQMLDLRWSIDDLTEQLRQTGIFDISEVDYAVVETSGSLSAYQRFGSRPASADLLNIQANGAPDAPPVTIISDGELIEQGLQFNQLDHQWLDNILRDNKVTIKDVFLLTSDRSSNYHLVRKEGKQA